MLAVNFNGSVRKWLIIGAVVLAVFLGAGLLMSRAAHNHQRAAAILIEDTLPLLGTGDPSKVLPLFVAGALPDDTSVIEARLKSWAVMGALKEHGPIEQLGWSWQSSRGYKTEGTYRVRAQYAAGSADIFWTIVTTSDGKLGVYDISVGEPSEQQ